MLSWLEQKRNNNGVWKNKKELSSGKENDEIKEEDERRVVEGNILTLVVEQ